MPRQVDEEIILGFVAEADDYLPVIRQSLARYAADYQRVDELQLAYRHLHTISGAAAMVGLEKVRQPAKQAEIFLEPFATIAHEPLPEGMLGTLLEQLDYIEVEFTNLRGHRIQVELPLTPSFANLPAPSAPAASTTGDSDIDQELLEIFAEEAEEHLQSLNENITQLSSQPDNLEVQKLLRRSAHTLKGAAAMVGFATLSQLAYRIENLLDRLLDTQTSPDEDTLVLLTASTELLDLLARGTSETQLAEELAELHSLYESMSGPAPTAGETSAETHVEMFAVPPQVAELAVAHNAEADDVIDPELLEVFMIEAEEHIQVLGLQLDILSRQPENRAALDELRRSAHTLKGSASLVGLDAIAQLAHRMEDLLDRLHAGRTAPDAATIALLMASTETLDTLARAPQTAGLQQNIAGLYARYTEWLTPAQELSPAAITPDQIEEAIANWSQEVVPEFPTNNQVQDFAITFPSEMLPLPLLTPETQLVSQPVSGGSASASGEILPMMARQQAPATAGRVVRIPLERLDEIVKLVSELLISRTMSEQKLADLNRQVQELRLSTSRLQRVSQRLESDYEASALHGLRSAKLSPVIQQMSATAAFSSGGLLFQPQDTESAAEFDELEFDRYTEFHRLSRELSETAGDTEAISQDFSFLLQDFEGLLTGQRRLTTDLYERLMHLRMIPLSMLAPRFKRAVQVAAQQLGKEAELVLEGEHIEIDTLTLDAMADPLLHLLRNAVAHGLTSPAARRACQKPTLGRIYLSARQEGNEVILRVGDDGEGLDLAAIRAKAAALGLFTESELAQMETGKIHSLIFLPGFSTAAEVTQVAGRGVGMDVLHNAVTQLQGVITIDSQPGQGTTFIIRLPVALAVTRALMLGEGKDYYALPFSSITRALFLQPEQVSQRKEGAFLNFNGEEYPLLRLSQLLNLPLAPIVESDDIPVLIVKSGDYSIALQIDEVLEGRDIVLKSLGTHLGRVPMLLGATILGDGRVVPVLNPVELVQQGVTGTLSLRPPPRARVTAERQLTALIVDDSPSVRRIMTRMIEARGGLPLLAKDGLAGLELLPTLSFRPDIILLDMEMPRMDGYEFLTALRGTPQWQNIPVIMITSRAGDKHRTKALELGASDYIVKPYQDETLWAAIQRLTRAPALSLMREIFSSV